MKPNPFEWRLVEGDEWSTFEYLDQRVLKLLQFELLCRGRKELDESLQHPLGGGTTTWWVVGDLAISHDEQEPRRYHVGRLIWSPMKDEPEGGADVFVTLATFVQRDLSK